MTLRHALLLVHAETVPPTPWRNGGGSTRELLAWPAGSEWQLRISLADIERDGPFSVFSGVQRYFAVVAGAGVQLHFGPSVRRVTPNSKPLRFDGADAPICALIDGPTRDLNLMHRGGDATMQNVLPGVAWDEDCAERGLFTVGGGTLHTAAHGAVELGRFTLAWSLERGACHFAANSLSDPALWLGWTPGKPGGESR